MKRYKLKKDLPTFRAGDKFFINECGDLLSDVYRDTSNQIEFGITAYCASTLEKFPNILKDWFEEIPEETKTVWDLKEGDDAWFIDCGCIKKYVAMDSFEFNLFQYIVEVGDGFLTLEGAKKELNRRKAKQILLRDTKGFKPNIYDLDQKRYYVSYDPVEKDLWYSYEDYSNVSHNIVFATKEDAEASIKAHPQEWKTYLGVEE